MRRECDARVADQSGLVQIGEVDDRKQGQCGRQIGHCESGNTFNGVIQIPEKTVMRRQTFQRNSFCSLYPYAKASLPMFHRKTKMGIILICSSARYLLRIRLEGKKRQNCSMVLVRIFMGISVYLAVSGSTGFQALRNRVEPTS